MLCRWISTRAAGISRITLDFRYARNSDDRSGIRNANADLLVDGLLPTLLALLRGSWVEMELLLEGKCLLITFQELTDPILPGEATEP